MKNTHPVYELLDSVTEDESMSGDYTLSGYKVRLVDNSNSVLEIVISRELNGIKDAPLFLVKINIDNSVISAKYITDHISPKEFDAFKDFFNLNYNRNKIQYIPTKSLLM